MTRLTDDQLQSLSRAAEDAASRGLALTVAGARIVDFVADHMELQAEFRRVRRALERAESGTELMELRKALTIIATSNLVSDAWVATLADEALNPKAPK